jgi:hypothetical protein
LFKTFVFVFNKRIHFFIGKKTEKKGKIIFSIIWSIILSNVMGRSSTSIKILLDLDDIRTRSVAFKFNAQIVIGIYLPTLASLHTCPCLWVTGAGLFL